MKGNGKSDNSAADNDNISAATQSLPLSICIIWNQQRAKSRAFGRTSQVSVQIEDLILEETGDSE